MRVSLRSTRRCLCLVALVVLVTPAAALAASKPSHPATGSLKQLSGRMGCVVARSTAHTTCARARALSGPAPILGSQAIAVSPDGRNVYVASSGSNAVTIFKRDAATGALTQAYGTGGCISVGAGSGCARAIAFRHPNSVAVSPDGKNVYVTSLVSNSVVTLKRNKSTGALTQLKNGGCIANVATPGCTTGQALDGPDVVAVSPDGDNVYVGSFLGSELAVFSRNTKTGALTQLTGGAGCFVNTATSGCTTAIGLGSPEGLTVSPDGQDVYVAAPGSGALDTFARSSTDGSLTQATDGTGCISDTALTGCALGTQLDGADAVQVSPNNVSVYVTSLLSNAVAVFSRSPAGQLTQLNGTSACVINILAVGCGLGRQLSGPEGVAVSPGSTNVYAVGYTSGSLDVFNRDTGWGAVAQKTRLTGCLTVGAKPGCTSGRALRGAGSVTVSPDGKNVYTAAFKSNAVAIFKRVNR